MGVKFSDADGRGSVRQSVHVLRVTTEGLGKNPGQRGRMLGGRETRFHRCEPTARPLVAMETGLEGC